MPLARAKSFAVPPGITASGTPRPPARSATGAIVPSPPLTTIAVDAGDPLELVQPEDLGVAAAARRATPGSSPRPDLTLATKARRTRVEDTLAAVFGRIDHIGVAVADLESAIELHTRAYGMPLVHRETIAEQGVEAVLLDVGESHVELLRPLSEESPVGRFLAKKGPGLHHVAYQVEDVDAALQTAREAGLRLIDETPRTGIRGTQVAFLHPATAGGVLTELVQPVEAH